MFMATMIAATMPAAVLALPHPVSAEQRDPVAAETLLPRVELFALPTQYATWS